MCELKTNWTNRGSVNILPTKIIKFFKKPISNLYLRFHTPNFRPGNGDTGSMLAYISLSKKYHTFLAAHPVKGWAHRPFNHFPGTDQQKDMPTQRSVPAVVYYHRSHFITVKCTNWLNISAAFPRYMNGWWSGHIQVPSIGPGWNMGTLFTKSPSRTAVEVYFAHGGQ